MKLFIVTLCLATVYCDKLDNTYLPPGNARTAGGSGNFLAAPRPFAAAPAARPAGSGSVQPAVPIIKANSEVNVDGSFRYEFETANGISAQEAGNQRSVGSEEINDVQGAFSYTGDDGVQYSITYTADENGFIPQGAHIPTAPPIPAEILKALEQNAADEARGIVDDGSYQAAASPVSANKQYIAPRPAPRPAPSAHAGYRY